MSAMPLEQAEGHLCEIIEKLAPGEEIQLTRDDKPVAKLVKVSRTSWPCRAGSAKHKIHRMAPDFDAPLEEFKEYME